MDKHLTEIEIAGRKYPLNYSIRASRLMREIPTLDQDATVQDAFEQNVKYLFVLLQEGAEFQKRFLGEESGFTLTADDLFSYFAPGDMNEIAKAINDAIAAGRKREVEVKPAKNAGAAAGKETRKKAG